VLFLYFLLFIICYGFPSNRSFSELLIICYLFQ